MKRGRMYWYVTKEVKFVSRLKSVVKGRHWFKLYYKVRYDYYHFKLEKL